jgi:hypothetical protein
MKKRYKFKWIKLRTIAIYFWNSPSKFTNFYQPPEIIVDQLYVAEELISELIERYKLKEKPSKMRIQELIDKLLKLIA